MNPDTDSVPAAPRGLLSTSLISILFGPTVGYLWVGRGRLALGLLVLVLLLIPVYLWGLHAGYLWSMCITAVVMDPVWGWIGGGMLSLLLVLPFRVHRRPNQWYSRGWGFAGGVVLLGLGTIIVAVLVRSFLFQPFSIPSSSMEPTLMPGDYVFADKRSYGVGPYSLPFGPWWSGGAERTAPKRGDIVIFRHPNLPGGDYVKRLIGLPGDTVELIQGQVLLNNAPLALEESAETEVAPHEHSGRIYHETLPDGRSYLVQDMIVGSLGDDVGPIVVPPGHFFALGDNRDNSDDSRFSMGTVPIANLIGRADVVFWNSERTPFRERRNLVP